MLDLFGSKAKAELAETQAKLSAAEARNKELEESITYERAQKEGMHRQILAMVDAKILDWVPKPPAEPRLPTDLRPAPPTKIGRLGKRSRSFVGQVRTAILARTEEPKDAA